MRLPRSAVLAACACALFPAAASARVGVTQHAINVTLLHGRTLARQSPRAQSDAAIVRSRARQCLDGLKAAPAAARRDLGRVYLDAVGGALWQTDRAGFAAWVRRLAPAAKAGPVWRSARNRLRSELARADARYGRVPDDVCPVLDSWRADGFAASAPPPEVTDARRAARDAIAGAPGSLRRLLDGVGTAAARRALALFDAGIGEPRTRAIRPGDPVWAVLR
ncbi:MAG: hypothetical protein ACXVFN_19460 [Solirubrobacteraceae bacterium]